MAPGALCGLCAAQVATAVAGSRVWEPGVVLSSVAVPGRSCSQPDTKLPRQLRTLRCSEISKAPPPPQTPRSKYCRLEPKCKFIMTFVNIIITVKSYILERTHMSVEPQLSSTR